MLCRSKSKKNHLFEETWYKVRIIVQSSWVKEGTKQKEREEEPNDNQVDHFQVADMDPGGRIATPLLITPTPLNLLTSGHYLAYYDQMTTPFSTHTLTIMGHTNNEEPHFRTMGIP